MKNVKGIWFYGLSGAGKSYASHILKNLIKYSIIVDGDNVRKWVSTDLNYSKKHREIQISRIFGISKIIIEANFFPIASSVYFNQKLLKLCSKNNVLVYKIERENFETIKKIHKTYKNKKNVVGNDIAYPTIKSNILLNDNTPNFLRSIKKIRDLVK